MAAIQVLRSLHFKVAAGVITTILLISALYIIFDYQSSRRQQLTDLQESAQRLASVTLQGLLELAMVGEHPEMLQPALQRLGDNSSVRRISLIDLSGRIRFSSRPDDLGRRLSKQQKGCVECHRTSPPTSKQSLFFSLNGEEILRNVSPVPNRKPCHRCHPESQENNGVLIIDFSTVSIQKRLSANLRETIYRAALLAFLTLVVLGVLMNKLVIIRLRKLTQAVQQAEGSEFPAFSKVDGKDEIGQLARSYEAMTARVQTSFQKLERQQAYLQKLINSLPDGLLVVNSQLHVEMTNRAATRFWSTRQLEKMFDLNDPTLPEVLRAVQEVFRNGTLITQQVPIRQDAQAGPSLGRMFVELYCAPVRDSQERIVNAIVLLRDVTQRKRLEAEAARADRLASVGRLAAGVAHEINNPMAAITTCVEGLSRHVVQSSAISDHEKQEIRDYLSTVGEAAQRCKEITQRLLSAAVDPEPGEFEVIDLREVVSQTITLVEHQAHTQGVQIHTLPAGEPPFILGDRRKLSQLMLNLLLNALEALREGGRIDVAMSQQSEFINLQVSDEGGGIPQADLEHIFDPFFTTKTGGRGTGLGLSISQWIVRQHHGRIEVESQPGRGTTFSILFPRHQ